MVIPKYYNEFFPAFSNCLSDGAAHTLEEIREYYADSFNLRREDRSATLENFHDLQVSREKGALPPQGQRPAFRGLKNRPHIPPAQEQ